LGLEQRYFADLRARREPLAQADQITRHAQLAHFDAIQIDARERVVVPPASEGFTGRLAFIAGALVAASGWVIISVLPLPFASVRIERAATSSGSPADISDFKKGDRLQISNATLREPVGNREASANVAAAKSQNRPSPQMGAQATKTPRHIAPVTIKAGDLETTKLFPAPETRPTTIEGWTLRDVTNGMAELEGPNGTWRVARGDTIPGLGRIDSIFQWGNRLMVATSSGLISTP
jgi:hypothetical protein